MRLHATDDGVGIPIAAFELELTYPPGDIDVVDAVPETTKNHAPNKAGVVWMDDDESTGTLRISGLSHPGDGSAQWGVGKDLEVVFELLDGARSMSAPAPLR